eukprot:127195_1
MKTTMQTDISNDVDQPYRKHYAHDYYIYKCENFISSQFVLSDQHLENIEQIIYGSSDDTKDKKEKAVIMINKNTLLFTVTSLPYNDQDEKQFISNKIKDIKEENSINHFNKESKKIAYICDDHYVLNPVICGYNIEQQSICLHFFEESIKYHNYKATSSKQQHQWVTSLNNKRFSVRNEHNAQQGFFKRKNAFFYLRDDYKLVFAEICGINDDKSKILIRFTKGISKNNMYGTSPDDEYKWIKNMDCKRFFSRFSLDKNEDESSEITIPQIKNIVSITDVFKNPERLPQLLNDPKIEYAFKVLLDDQHFEWKSAEAWNSILSFLQIEHYGNYTSDKAYKYMSTIIESCNQNIIIDDNHSIITCDALKRIKKTLRNDDCLDGECEEIYPSSNMLNDFYHLITRHNDANQFDYIYRMLTRTATDSEYMKLDKLSCGFLRSIMCNKKVSTLIINSIQDLIIGYNTNYKECKLDCCICMRRNYRNRDIEHKMEVLYETCENKIICRKQLIDKIHCHYYHSYHTKHRQSPYTLETHNTNTTFVETICTRNSNKFDVLSDFTKNKLDEFSFGYQYDYYKEGAEWYIPAKYSKFGDELLNNEICSISITQLKNLLQKAEYFFTSTIWYAHFVTESYHPTQFTVINDTMRIPAYFPISPAHLVAILVYCNFEVLQFKFSQTYRKLTLDESDNSLKNRHSNYFWLGKLLLECVRIFGTSIESMWNDDRIFYHGINQKLMVPTTIGCKIFCPFSTTTSWAVAVQFAQNAGLVLEVRLFKKQVDVMHSVWANILSRRRGDYCKFFDCSFVSDFPAEQEKLFIGGLGTLQFTDIVETPFGHSYKRYLRAVDFIHKFVRCVWIRNSGQFPLQKKSYQDLSRVEQQLIFRIILNELHHHQLSTCPEFKSCPTYISTLFHQQCQSKTGSIMVFITEILSMRKRGMISMNNIDDFWKLFINKKWGITNWIDIIYSLFPLLSRIELKIDTDTDFVSYLLDISEFLKGRREFEFEGCYNGDTETNHRFERIYMVEEMINFMKEEQHVVHCRILSITLSNVYNDTSEYMSDWRRKKIVFYWLYEACGMDKDMLDKVIVSCICRFARDK